MAALERLRPDIRLHVFTTVPAAFFRQSCGGDLTMHRVETDVGLVQTSPLHADLPASLAKLDRFLPFPAAVVTRLAGQLRQARCRIVVCDIAPLGIAAARAAGIPSVLVENFTWDWIYEGYADEHPGFRPHIEYLRGVFRSADLHIQTEPVSAPRRGALRTPPVARPVRRGRDEIRCALGIPAGRPLVLITAGGMAADFAFLRRLADHPETIFVIPYDPPRETFPPNIIFIPRRRQFYHPDLVGACDAVVGKLGYSTLAEAWQAGVPFAYVMRTGFREAGALASFAARRMPSISLEMNEFSNGGWLRSLGMVLNLRRRRTAARNGSRKAADLILAEARPPLRGGPLRQGFGRVTPR
jgi:hypothetical protein